MNHITKKYLYFILVASCLFLTSCSNPFTNHSSDLQNQNDYQQDGNYDQSETQPSETESMKSTTEPETATPDVNDYVRVLDYIPDIEVELKYATDDNFTEQVIYDFDDAYLRYGTVLKLKDAQEQLKALGYRIKIWDAYRPFYAQEKMWEIYPNATYVANPAKGMSGHNLGNTMDITLVTLDGSEVTMPTEFDSFSKRADRNYSEIEEPAASNALLLQNIMYQNDFKGYYGEWWDFTDQTTYTEINDFMP